jgi:hypothetical protein
MRKIILAGGSIILVILLLCLVSAEAWFDSEPKSIYNIGDKLELTVSTDSGDAQLELELECKNKSKLIFSDYLNIGETQKQISRPLTSDFLGNIKGKCKIIARYKQETIKTNGFEITNNVDVDVNLEKLNYESGEQLIIKGQAVKENTEKLTGYVDIVIEDSGIRLKRNIVNGDIDLNFNLSENIKPGSYSLIIEAYEKNEQGDITNRGKSIKKIGIKQQPSKLEIAVNQQKVTPGKNISFKVILYDQSNNEMKGNIGVSIKNNFDEEVFKKLVSTDQEIVFPISTNASAGYWKIQASVFELSSKRLFYVEENQKAKFNILNDTLIITNIGNVPYKKAVQIVIGNEVEIKETEIPVGQSKKFRLLAPDGIYNVRITDGSNTYTESDVSLTGNIIGVMDIRKQLSLWNKYPMVWLFLIVIMGMFILMAVQRSVKKKVFAFPSKSKEPKKEKIKKTSAKQTKEIKTPQIGKSIVAEHTLVLNGKKQEIGLICIKINNKLNESLKKALKDIFSKAYESKKSAEYWTGDYVFLLFSPLVTRTLKNQKNAIKTALSIEKAIKEYNKKFKDKIDFGISVHTGEIANQLKGNKLKFTGLGNTLRRAKKLADISQQETLLTKEIHEKSIDEIRADKKDIQGQEVFKVKQIKDNQRNRQFIKEFLKRMEDEKK